MLKELKFVQGSVAKKDFLPSLTHFVIEGNTVRGYNGMLALCSPIPFNIECKPKAEPLIRAIGNCSDTVTLSLTPAGRLSIKSGGFKALIDCASSEETPHALPEGDRVDFDGEAMLNALKAVAPFIGDDASRPWTNGVLLRGESAYATNNVTLVEYWVGAQFPHVVNIPRAAVKEMLRIDEPPLYAQMTDNSITFHYVGDRWIRTQLFTTEWPDLKRVLDVDCNPLPLPHNFFDGLETIKHFVDKNGKVFLKDGLMFTHEGNNEGASYEIPDLQVDGLYNIEMLRLLEGTAKTIDLTRYPEQCIFYGDRLRGAIIGMRL